MAVAGDGRLRCIKCEYFLSVPKKLEINNYDYGIEKNKHGVVVRKCMNDECNQLYVCYMQLSGHAMKTILKMIDKLI